MDMTGEFRIPAPRRKVWEALNDPEILKRSIPGCEEIEKVSPTELAAKVTAKVGPVKARFGGKVILSDLDPPNGYKITGEGSGGAARWPTLAARPVGGRARRLCRHSPLFRDPRRRPLTRSAGRLTKRSRCTTLTSKSARRRLIPVRAKAEQILRERSP